MCLLLGWYQEVVTLLDEGQDLILCGIKTKQMNQDTNWEICFRWLWNANVGDVLKTFHVFKGVKEWLWIKHISGKAYQYSEAIVYVYY